MRYKKVINIFLLLFICMIAQKVLGQTNYSDVNVDQWTDAQIRQLMQKGASIGYNDAQVEQMAAAQGMSTGEVEKLKLRIEKIRKQDSNYRKLPGNNNRSYADSTDSSRTSRNFNNRDAELRDAFGNLIPKIFGEELFRNSKISFEPNLRMVTPKSYVIGPDDELLIDITGDNEANYNLKVSPEGAIRLQYVGVIGVGGLTIEQAISKLRKSMSKTYPGLLTGRTSIAITLGNIRSIKVTIIGEAVKPGSYTLPSLASVFNALYASGGPNKNGSFRKIQVIRDNRVVSTIDVYNFLLKGIQNNIRLQDQDIINIPVYQTRVEMSGEVKRPALYEVLNKETLQDVINFAGGFSSQAYSANIKVLQNTSKERRIIDVNADNFATYKPLNGDRYVVEPILNRFANRVEINGAVFRPGKFELDKGLTLRGLITKADGLREDAFLNSGYILRLNSDNSLSMLPFNVGNVVNGSESDIPLQREDKVTISSIFDLRNEYRVEIQGEVRNPGIFNYATNMNLESAIQMAGGFKEGATPNRIEISRRVKNSDAKSVTAITAQIFTVDVDQNLRLMGKPFILQPYDIISVRSSEGYEIQKQVKVEGEVLYPGTYTIERKDEKISDLIKRAGGLTAMAFSAGASLERPGPKAITIDTADSVAVRDKNAINKTGEERERLTNLQRIEQQHAGAIDTASLKHDPSIVRSSLVGIDLGKILQMPSSRYDLLLEDGDIIKVPKLLQTVRVSGEVLKPTNIVYQPGKKILEYINESGGFTYNAKKRAVYIEYANGSIRSTKRFLFFHHYPKVKPGAEIFVPKHPPKESLGIQAIIGISSALASLAVVVVALLKL
ncbi:MAG: capsule biosynthesis protein [Mucilaginibacter sp.]|nr:capsule biosynthesis protein [Mucilaginibacter sp.]